MCPQFVASCWPLLCLDHSPDNPVNNSHGENNLTNRPERVHPLDRVRGDALLRDAGEARLARRLGSLDLEGGGRLGPGILGILRVLHLELTDRLRRICRQTLGCGFDKARQSVAAQQLGCSFSR